MTEHVFVTGGSGFIGTQVIDRLLARGAIVTNYDLKAPTVARADATWIAGDVVDRAALTRALGESGATRVIHLAAKADISSGWEALASIHAGTDNLLAAIDATPAVRALTNISTQLVIGPNHQPRSLLDFRPYTIYGEAKAFAEAAVLQWQSDVAWLTVRPANIWGPRHPTFRDEIWKYIANRRYLHPTGATVLRSYGYVDNTAQQIVDLAYADSRKTHRQAYYAADGVTDSAEWVDAFAQALTGRPARRVPTGVLRALGRAGDASARLGGPAPINSGRVLRMTSSYPVPVDATFALVGAPQVTVAQGVAATMAWLRGEDAPHCEDPKLG